MRVWGPKRKIFVEKYTHCNCCGRCDQLWCHEITRGSDREAALSKRCSWLAVCNHCNQEELTDAEKWPLPRQLALKWLCDRKHFDLSCICKIRGRAPTCVTMAEVIPYVCRIMDRSTHGAEK